MLGRNPAGICVVTAMVSDGSQTGMVVGSFTTGSLEPPLVAYCPEEGSSGWPLIEKTDKLCANVLASNREATCLPLAKNGADDFVGITHRKSDSGSRIIDGVVAWIDCNLDAIHDGKRSLYRNNA